MDIKSINPTWISAIGSILVAILAIWGDYFRSLLAGPKLTIDIYNPKGDFNIAGVNIIGEGKYRYYYHLKIKNVRQWSPAKRVRILCTSIARKQGDKFTPESLVIPVQLTWAFPSLNEATPIISTEKICDIGYVGEKEQHFVLTPYIVPNNFRGIVSKGETIRIGLVAEADNYVSKKPYYIDIYWDGNFSRDKEVMAKHLVISEAKDRK